MVAAWRRARSYKLPWRDSCELSLPRWSLCLPWRPPGDTGDWPEVTHHTEDRPRWLDLPVSPPCTCSRNISWPPASSCAPPSAGAGDSWQSPHCPSSSPWSPPWSPWSSPPPRPAGCSPTIKWCEVWSVRSDVWRCKVFVSSTDCIIAPDVTWTWFCPIVSVWLLMASQEPRTHLGRFSLQTGQSDTSLSPHLLLAASRLGEFDQSLAVLLFYQTSRRPREGNSFYLTLESPNLCLKNSAYSLQTERSSFNLLTRSS